MFRRTLPRISFFLIFVMMVSILGINMAKAYVGTDKPDYPPASVVTISGGNNEAGAPGYVAGQLVSVSVVSAMHDPAVETNNCVDVPVSPDGTWSCTVTLWSDPAWSVGEYQYTATSASGITEGGIFTDSVTSVKITSPTHASPVTITSLPATLIVNFDYVTSLTGTTTAKADILGTGSTGTKNITPGSSSDSIVVTIPVGTANGSYNVKVTIENNTGTGSNNGNDNQNGAVEIKVAKINPICTVTGYTATYDGNPHTASGSCTGVGGVTLSGLDLSGTTHTNVGTYTEDAWSFAGDNNYNSASGTVNDSIVKATSSVTVTCTASVVYTGSAQAPCTAKASGVGMSDVDVTASLVYANNTNPGTATASASWSGDANHDGNTGSATFEITKATSSVTVTCPASVVYNGSAQTPCTAKASGVAMSDVELAVSYTSNTNAGMVTASASWGGDANHDGSNGTGGFNITKAPSTVTVTCSASVIYIGSAQTPCTAKATGVGMADVNVSASLVYDNNTNAGTASASASWDGDANHTGNTGSATFEITKATAVITVTPYAVIYDGNAHTATGTAKGVEATPVDLISLLNLSGTTHTNAGTYNGDAWSFAGNNNYNSASGTVDDSIAKAPSTVTVTCSASVIYIGSAQTPCTAKATGVGMADVSVTASLVYSNNTNAGTASASASWDGDANHTGNTGSATFEITKATAVITVTPYSVTYDGDAHTATGTATGVNDESLSGLDLSKTTHTNAGTYSDIWTFTDATGNYKNASGSVNDSIARASSTTEVTCPTSVTYTGLPLTPCSASATGVGGLNQTVTVNYANNIVGTATASAAFSGDANHNGSSDSASFAILYATGQCYGAPGHTILQPINADGLSVFKQKSTVPAKFRVCDANGNSIGTPGVVESFKVVLVSSNPSTPVNEDVVSTTPDTAFRWSATDQQWIFNINTKNLGLYKYSYLITLNDGSTIPFSFGLK